MHNVAVTARILICSDNWFVVVSAVLLIHSNRFPPNVSADHDGVVTGLGLDTIR